MNETDEMSDVEIEPGIAVKLPRVGLNSDEVIKVLKDVVQSARVTWEEEKTAAVEEAIKKCEEKTKSQERKIRLESYDEGLSVALAVCTFPIHNTNSNCSLVKGHPGIPKEIIDVLSKKTGTNDPSEYSLWKPPKFDDAEMYLADQQGSLKMLLGYFEGEEVFAITDGGVTAAVLDEDAFFGSCTISLDDDIFDGYCMGHILYKGTALILGADEELYLFTHGAALHPEWSAMEGSRGAILEIDPEGKITLSRLPGLEVESLAEW